MHIELKTIKISTHPHCIKYTQHIVSSYALHRRLSTVLGDKVLTLETNVQEIIQWTYSRIVSYSVLCILALIFSLLQCKSAGSINDNQNAHCLQSIYIIQDLVHDSMSDMQDIQHIASTTMQSEQNWRILHIEQRGPVEKKHGRR